MHAFAGPCCINVALAFHLVVDDDRLHRVCVFHHDASASRTRAGMPFGVVFSHNIFVLQAVAMATMSPTRPSLAMHTHGVTHATQLLLTSWLSFALYAFSLPHSPWSQVVFTRALVECLFFGALPLVAGIESLVCVCWCAESRFRG